MKYLIGIMGAVLLVTGCDDFRGTFKAHKNLQLVHTKTFGKKKIINLAQGDYKASMRIASADKLKLKFTSSSGNEVEVRAKLNQDVQFPRTSGSIDLPVSVTGQKYDINGDLDTEYRSSESIRDIERCYYTDYRNVCRHVCKDETVVNHPRRDTGRPDVSGGCGYVCRNEPVQVEGSKDVIYHIEFKEEKLQLIFLDPKTKEEVGRYKGGQNSSYKVYEFEGACL